LKIYWQNKFKKSTEAKSIILDKAKKVANCDSEVLFFYFLQGPTLIGPSQKKKKNIIGNIRHAADSNTLALKSSCLQLHQL